MKGKCRLRWVWEESLITQRLSAFDSAIVLPQIPCGQHPSMTMKHPIGFVVVVGHDLDCAP